MRNEIGIEFIPFKCIPLKSLDVSPVDRCAFGLLKLFTSGIPKHWMDCGRLWLKSATKINLSVLRKAFLSFKSRFNMKVQQMDYQTEHIR